MIEPFNIDAAFYTHTYGSGSKHPRTHFCPYEVETCSSAGNMGYVCIAKLITGILGMGKHYEECKFKNGICPIIQDQ